MNLSVGVLLSGSLYWDSQSHREKWRQDRLEVREDFTVKVPIRYGRISMSRGNTYTTVFSPRCELGKAKAVRCRNPVASLEDLVEEAECLWAAERPTNAAAKSSKGLSANWGCVALLMHPRFSTSDNKALLQQLLDGWTQRVFLEPNYNGDGYLAVDGAAVNRQGLLQFSWPDLHDGNGPLPMDLLLAIVAKPSLDGEIRGYPVVNSIAEAWRSDKQGNVHYFWCNRKSGIHTFQDDEIIARLQ